MLYFFFFVGFKQNKMNLTNKNLSNIFKETKREKKIKMITNF